MRQFFKCNGICYKVNELLRDHCTWRIGGPADFIIEPISWQQIEAVFQITHKYGIPIVVIGKGSNLLFNDAGIRGIVIKMGRNLSRFHIAETIVQAESGISAPRLAHIVGLAGLSGLEHIIGIPSTIGGLVDMNGGSLRKAIGDVITGVRIINRQGNIQTLSRKECKFNYRRSRFQNEFCAILEVTMELVPGHKTIIMAEMLRILRERRKKFPLNLPNCGSVFKSDPQSYESLGSPGKIIEGLGLKRFRIGDAEISEQHANFIINRGQASAKDVLAVINHVRKQVFKFYGMWISCEVRYVDSSGRIDKADAFLMN